MLDSRRVLAPAPKVHPRFWDQNTSRIQISRHFDFISLCSTGWREIWIRKCDRSIVRSFDPSVGSNCILFVGLVWCAASVGFNCISFVGLVWCAASNCLPCAVSAAWREVCGGRHLKYNVAPDMASDSHLDLSCPPYVLYGIKYIDLVPLALFSGNLFQDHLQRFCYGCGHWKVSAVALPLADVVFLAGFSCASLPMASRALLYHTYGFSCAFLVAPIDLLSFRRVAC